MPAGRPPKHDRQLERQVALRDIRYWAIACGSQIDRINVWLSEMMSGRRPLHGGSEDDFRFRVQGNADQHLLLVTGNQLCKALAQAEGASERLALRDHEPMRILRNIYEHWEQHRPAFQAEDATFTRAGKQFRDRWPEQTPWSFRWTVDDGAWIGPLSLTALADDLHEIEEELRTLGVIPPP